MTAMIREAIVCLFDGSKKVNAMWTGRAYFLHE